MKQLITLALISTALLSACGGGGSSSNPDPAPQPPAPTVNTAPLANEDNALAQNNNAITIDVLANDTDSEGDELTISAIIEQSGLGNVEIVANKIVYTPEQDNAGIETVTYEITDGELTSQAYLEVIYNHTLTLEGLVTDAPIANALVSVTLGNNTFETVADGQGNYSLPIIINDMASSIFIKALGNPDNGQTGVELITVAGQAFELFNVMNENRAVTNEESNITNVTHVSTSSYLLAKQLNGNNIPTAENFAELLSQISTDELLNIAGFIKLLVDNEGFDLPEDISVFELLEQENTIEEAINQYLVFNGFADESGEQTPEYEAALEQAINDTTSDASVMQYFNLEMLVGKSVIALASTKDGWLQSRASSFSFNDNGIGSFKQYQDSWNGNIENIDFNWVINNGNLEIEYEEVSITIESGWVDAPFQKLNTDWGFPQSTVDEFISLQNKGIIGSQIYLELKSGLAKESYTLISDSSKSFFVNVIAENYTEIATPNEPNLFEEPPRLVEELQRTEVLQYEFESLFSSSELADLEGEWVLYFESEFLDYMELEQVTELVGDIVTLNENTAIPANDEQQYTTSLNQGTLELTNGDTVYKFTPFQQINKLYLATIEKWNAGEREYIVAGQITRFDDTYNLFTENLVTELSEVQLAVNFNNKIDDWDNDKRKFENTFGYYFNYDGTLRRVFSHTPETDRSSEVNYFGFDFLPWTWEIFERQVDLYSDEYGRYRHRTWQVVSVDEEGRAIIYESSVLGYDQNENGEVTEDEIGQLVRPRINIIMKEDLSQWEEEWQNTIDLGEMPN